MTPTGTHRHLGGQQYLRFLGRPVPIFGAVRLSLLLLHNHQVWAPHQLAPGWVKGPLEQLLAGVVTVFGQGEVLAGGENVSHQADAPKAVLQDGLDLLHVVLRPGLDLGEAESIHLVMTLFPTLELQNSSPGSLERTRQVLVLLKDIAQLLLGPREFVGL